MIQYNPLLLESESTTKEDIGLGLAGLSIASTSKRAIDNNYDDLMGTVTRYHNTSKANVDSIKQVGIKSSFATDPNNITNRVLRDVPMKDKEGIVYLGKKKNIGKNVGYNRSLRGLDPAVNFRKNPIKSLFNFGGKNIKIRFNLDDYDRLIKVDNPELRNAKSAKEFYNKTKGILDPDWEKLNFFQKANAKSIFKLLGKEGTDAIKGDIDASHIIGSKHYKKATDFKRWLKYVKKHPERFTNGVIKSGLSAARIGAAIYAAKKLYDKRKNKKS